LPAVHPQCAVALRVTFNPGERRPAQAQAELRQRRRPTASCRPSKSRWRFALPDDVHFSPPQFIINIQQLKVAEAGVCIRGCAGWTTNRKGHFRWSVKLLPQAVA